MSVVISVDNDSLSVIDGSVKGKTAVVRSFKRVELPKNTVDNGKINNMQQAREALAKALEGAQVKKAGIVFESSKILFREIVLPITRAKETREMVKNEMANIVGLSGGLVSDYIALKRDAEARTDTLLAFAVEGGIIQGFIDLLADGGIKCSSVDIEPNCLGKTLDFIGCGEGVYCVIKLNKESIDICLIDGGCPVLSRAIRLNLELLLETDALNIGADEIADNFSNIVQFQKTRNNARNIEGIFIIGNMDKQEALANDIGKRTGIECRVLGESGLISSGGDFSLISGAEAFGGLIRRNGK